jgi:hypothetical protein
MKISSFDRHLWDQPLATPSQPRSGNDLRAVKLSCRESFLYSLNVVYTQASSGRRKHPVNISVVDFGLETVRVSMNGFYE